MIPVLSSILGILYVISSSAYWCFHKHWGTVGLNCIAACLTASAYLSLMGTYLFDSERLLHILLIGVLVLFTAIALFAERMLLIEEPTRLFLFGVLLFLNILLLFYAKLLLAWNTITPEYLLYTCLCVGISTGIAAGFLFEGAHVRFSTKCFYLYEQLLKLCVGFLVSFFILFMLNRLRGTAAVSFALSFLFSFWGCGIYPVLIKKIQHYEYKNH